MSLASWVIRLDEREFFEDDLDLEGCVRACELAGCKWADLHPLNGPAQFTGILAAFIAMGKPPEVFDQAVAEVSRLPQGTALAMVEAVARA